MKVKAQRLLLIERQCDIEENQQPTAPTLATSQFIEYQNKILDQRFCGLLNIVLKSGGRKTRSLQSETTGISEDIQLLICLNKLLLISSVSHSDYLLAGGKLTEKRYWKWQLARIYGNVFTNRC